MVFGHLALTVWSKAGWCHGDLDRQYRLETVGVLKAVDDVGGVFSEYLEKAIERYFTHQNRFLLVDLNSADQVFTNSKLAYEKVVFDPEILKRLAQSARVESLVRIQVRKSGAVYFFTLEWLHSPKMEVITELHFELDEPKREGGFLGMESDQDILLERLKDQLSKLFHQLPFFGQVSGRDHDQVVLNIGQDEGLKQGDQVELATLEEVKLHPLMNRIVDWKFRPAGQVVIERVDAGMAFCRLLSEEPGVEISRFQKVVRVSHLPAPQITPAEPEVLNAVKGPQLGWLGLSLPAGSYNRPLYATNTGVVSNQGSGIVLGGQLDGEILLTRNWFFGMRLGSEAWTFSQKNSSGNLTPASSNGGVPGSNMSYLFNLGYRVDLSDLRNGSRGWGKVGFKSTQTQLPSSASEQTGPLGLSSFFLGLGGSCPVAEKWSAYADFKFRLLSFASLNGVGASSSSDFDVFLGGAYQLSSVLSLRVEFDYRLRGVAVSGGTSVDQNMMTIAPGLLYHF